MFEDVSDKIGIQYKYIGKAWLKKKFSDFV